MALPEEAIFIPMVIENVRLLGVISVVMVKYGRILLTMTKFGEKVRD